MTDERTAKVINDLISERNALRAALEQIRVFALQETHGSSAGYKGIADRLAGDLLKVTTIAREALRGAVAGVRETSAARCEHSDDGGHECKHCDKSW